ncbi:MAG: glycosyltransferase [Clostridia bacterium]|nr:glycosyltransferase [Clostridia bacterium]
MKLFDLTFGNNIQGTGALFYRGGAAYDKSGGRLIIPAGGKADFGTYFNLLPYCTYRTYCGAEKITLALRGSGRYTVELRMRTTDGAVVILNTLQADGNFSADIGIGSLPDGGYLYFTVYSQQGCELYGGYWSDESIIGKDIKIAVVMCTYNREKFVRENLARMAAGIQADSVWADRLHVFIVDNAKSLNLEENSFYTVIPNKNIGGTGGFTRGMCIAADGDYTHFLLIDDDIDFDFNTIQRTWYLAAGLTPKHEGACIGGAMLILEQPCLQHELGGKFGGLMQRSVNNKLDVRLTQNLLANENAEKPDYLAWWFCCMPVSYIKENGLPMPLFIKDDDIEYGLRGSAELICTNGLAVWHSDFAGKYNGALEYYIKRNEAIVCALQCKRTRFSVAGKFLYFAHMQLLLKDYGCAEAMIRGYRDFMKGSRFLLESDPEEINAEVHSHEEQNFSYEEIENMCGVNPDSVKYKKPLKTNLIKKAILFTENYTPRLFFRDKTGVTDIKNLIPSRAYLKKTVIKCNSIAKTGYICRLDVKRRRKVRGQITRTFFAILFHYGKVRKDFRRNAEKLCSRENWEKLFNS